MSNVLIRTVASTAVVASLLLGSAAPVLASCVMPPSIDEAVRDADLVFLGTVTSLSNNDRWATVTVEEVWKGPDLAPVVEVRGGPGGNAASSVDRSFLAGTRYLFLPFIAEGVLQDSACSSTTQFTAELSRLRPATARQPVTPAPDPDTAAPFDTASLLLPAALIIGAGVLVFGGVLVLRRRT